MIKEHACAEGASHARICAQQALQEARLVVQEDLWLCVSTIMGDQRICMQVAAAAAWSSQCSSALLVVREVQQVVQICGVVLD